MFSHNHMTLYCAKYLNVYQDCNNLLLTIIPLLIQYEPYHKQPCQQPRLSWNPNLSECSSTPEPTEPKPTEPKTPTEPEPTGGRERGGAA